MKKKQVTIVLWRSEDGVVHRIKLTKGDILRLKPSTQKKLNLAPVQTESEKEYNREAFIRESFVNSMTELLVALDKFSKFDPKGWQKHCARTLKGILQRDIPKTKTKKRGSVAKERKCSG